MIELIRSEFRMMLKDEVTWMDKESKVKADEKVRKGHFNGTLKSAEPSVTTFTFKAKAIDVKIG